MIRPTVGRVGIAVSAVAVGLFAVFPFLWMILTSVKPRPEILTATPIFIPSELVLERYVDVLRRGFATYLRNSLIVAVTTTVAGVSVAALAGYSLARFKLPLRRYLVLVVLSTQMFPIAALIIPLFIVMRNLGLLDSLLGLVVTYMAFTTPLSIWILRGFFLGIPQELEEAAMVDGATRVGAMLRVVLPLAGPGLAAVGVFAFIAAWREFFVALTFITDEQTYTLPVALARFEGLAHIDWGGIMAASVLFTLPVVVFFLFVHRRLTQGMIAGSVKG
ncbi:MAG: carbohydrate ABC transporter permease [Actinobacteria bacterium]|nr:carbohydrate ABC transporter permease [Actinomycetota bacterium]